MKKNLFGNLRSILAVILTLLVFPTADIMVYADDIGTAGTSFDTAIDLSAGRQEGTFSSYSDNHYYKFTVPTSKVTVWLGTEDDKGYKTASLYDNNSEYLKGHSVKSGGKGADYYLLAGTYYIRTSGPKDGSYYLYYTYTKPSETVSESQTQRYDTISNAVGLTLDTTCYGILGINDSADSFYFDLPDDGTITVESFSAQYEHYGQFYDSQGVAEGSSFKSAIGKQDIYTLSMLKGRHYLIFTGEDGQYLYKIRYTPDESQHQHTYSAWTVVSEPTCTEEGSREQVCTVCGCKNTEVVAALSHDIMHHDAKAATCTEAGWAEYDTCSRCDYTTYKEMPALGHNMTSHEAEDANCTEAGCSAYWSCSTCGKYFSDANGKNEIIANNWIIEALDHDWGEWIVISEATQTENGEKKRECARCHETETIVIPALVPGSDPTQMGEDGTPIGPEASAAAAEQAITNMGSDTDLPGSEFSSLRLKSSKQTSSSITLNWAKVKGASSYIIYGNRCGKAYKPVKLATITGNAKKLTKVAGKKIVKGKYYKFLVVALDKNNYVVSTSKLIHVATAGGKVGNSKSVIVAKSTLNKAKALEKGKSLKLNAKAVPKSSKLTVRKHVAMRYETTNQEVATVSSSGKITAKSKGTCYVYAYAQNGVYKKIMVTVK